MEELELARQEEDWEQPLPEDFEEQLQSVFHRT